MNINYEKYNKKAGIYTIKCLKNDKLYVGSAKNLFDRICIHKSDLVNNKHKNRYLQFSFNKYGESNFHVEVIELVEDVKELLKREQYWIDSLNVIIPKGFNICNKAHSRLGTKASPETLLKMSTGLKGIKRTKEQKEAISKRMLGHNTSIETRRKIGDAHRGKKQPSARKKVILQLTLDNKVIKEWESMTQAADHLGFNVTKISQCCSGKRNKHKNFKWKLK